MERLVEEISFNSGQNQKDVVIDAAFVDSQLSELSHDEDLSRFIL
jgi:ATP-dependent HslUV protease ATP-binding subunit HslU